MSGVDPGKIFVADLICRQSKEVERVQNDDNGEDNIVDNDASAFSSLSIEEASAIGICDNLENCSDNNPGSNNNNFDSENSTNPDPLPELIEQVDPNR